MFFHCNHRRTTFPLTCKPDTRAPRPAYTGTYVSCLDCGKEFEYDWTTMRMGEAVALRQEASGERRVGLSVKGYPEPLQKPVK